MAKEINCAVIIPFFGRFEQLTLCVLALLDQSHKKFKIVLIDDGSNSKYSSSSYVTKLPKDERLIFLEHDKNHGVAKARNTGVKWCKSNSIDLILMIDSDCLPSSNFVSGHITLHERHPSASCIGGGMVSVGESVWAKLDNILSWVHSIPEGEVRSISPLYHLPTTNFSIKISEVPDREELFDNRLQTGEDALLIKKLIKRGKSVLFSPVPKVKHYDRNTLSDVLHHHYKWGYHQYFIQLGGNISSRCFKLWYRVLFASCFFFSIPLYALLGSCLNLLPWLKYRPSYIIYAPLIYIVWLFKACAILEAAISPNTVLRT